MTVMTLKSVIRRFRTLQPLHVTGTLLSALALWLSLSSVGGTASAGEEEILVVANLKVPVDAISEADLRAIFRKSRLSYPGGARAVPIHARSGSPLRRDFLRRVLHLTEAEEKKFWEEQKIRKGIKPPAEFSNTLKAVFHLKGAVSYVYRSQFKEGTAKVLLRLPAKG